jgi:UDP-N-acetylmuramoylalanine-D-glutamate ligase
MLEHVCEEHGGQSLFTINSESPDGALVHLKKAKSGDIVLMRISDMLLSELYAMRISPHVAVCTGVPPKGTYSTTPFEVLAYQTYNNFLVASDEVIDRARAGSVQPKAKMLRTKPSLIPTDWGFQGRGPHDRANAALAFQAGKLFKLEDDAAQDILGAWKPLKGRIEPVKKIKNIDFYNDTMATTPDAVLAGIMTVSENKNTILIFGGSDTGHDYRPLYAEIPRYAHTIIMLPGSGTIRQRTAINAIDGVNIHTAPTIEEAVRISIERANKGDRVLFSPGFDAGGVDGSKKERGEKFVRAVRGL